MAQKGKTLEQWNADLQAKYGNLYELKTLPIKYGAKAKVFCTKHGEFEVMPSILLGRQQGCKLCMAEKPFNYKTSASDAFEKVCQSMSEYEVEDFTSYYEGSRTEVTLVCSKHGKFTRKLKYLTGKDIRGCPTCMADAVREANLYPFTKFVEQASKKFSNKFTYDETTWTGVSNRVGITCPIHGNYLMFGQVHLASAHGCMSCAREAQSERQKMSLAEVEKLCREIHGNRYTYDFTGYEGYGLAKAVIRITCSEHGEFTQRLADHIYSKAGCPQCANAQSSVERTMNYAKFKTKADEVHRGKGYTYVESSFTRSTADVEVICPKHGQYTQRASEHLNGSGCSSCKYEKFSEMHTKSWEEVFEMIKEVHGDVYTYRPETYVNMNTIIDIVCDKHGIFQQKPINHIHARNGCPTCAGVVSRGEAALREFVQNLGLETESNKKYAGRKEVDIFIPSLNLAIEFDGLVWHSTKFKPRDKQLLKTQELKVLGIPLIRIFEDEWAVRQEQVKRLIAARLGKLELEKVYARKCQFTEPTNDEAKEFYNQYHIQGWNRHGSHVGLAYDGKLIAMMSFTKSTSHRGRVTEEGEWELARFATSHHVIGGASKLMKKFIADNGVTKLTSYSDNRLFTGGMYKALGFTEDGQVPPSYTYWKDGFVRLHKSKFRHSELPKILGSAYNPDLTERENCENNGYYQIYDDGLTRWILNLEKLT